MLIRAIGEKIVEHHLQLSLGSEPEDAVIDAGPGLEVLMPSMEPRVRARGCFSYSVPTIRSIPLQLSLGSEPEDASLRRGILKRWAAFN